MIPRPLAWGIVAVLTGLEALNVIAAIWVDGYHSDALVHFAFTTIIGAMLGVREGGTVTRALTAFRNISTPPPNGPSNPPPPSPRPPESEP